MTNTGSRQENSEATQSTGKIRLVGLNAKFIHSCLALFYIRNELSAHLPENDVEIMQLTINDNSYESLLQITSDSPMAVFFSAAIWNSDLVAQLVHDVRACLPDCRIVVGGPQAGVLREQLPDDLCTMVIGEIEAVGQDFYTDLLSGNLLPVYRGSFLKQQDKSLDYPFNDDDFVTHLENRHIYYESSRGCPFSCTYCLSASERGLYHKELDQVFTELRHILRHKPRVVRFVDRTFNDVPERAFAIWKFLIEQNTDTLFHFEIAPDRFSEEMFTLLEKVEHGRFQLEIGIQSTNEETLDAIRRRVDTTKIHAIISRLAALKTIHLHVDLILGLPYETPESFRKSFRDVFATGAHYIQMGLLKILPDTPICHGVEEYGYKHSTHPPYSIFANSWMNHEQIRQLYWFSEGVEKFYNNRYFVSLWKYLRESGEEMFVFFQRLLEEGQKVNVLHRAATQELLSSIIMAACEQRQDKQLIAELLRYDWLRCGHRKLPASLEFGEGEEDLVTARDILYRNFPDNVDEFFTYKTRNHFFKKSIFMKLSAEAARKLGFTDGNNDARIVVLQERDTTLYQHNITHVMESFRDSENV